MKKRKCARFGLKTWKLVLAFGLEICFDLKVYVGLKTLEDLNYEALHLEMTLEACSTHGGLLYLEVTFG